MTDFGGIGQPVVMSRMPGSVPVIDVDLLEFSVRGLARLTTVKGGMAAITKLHGIATLAAAVRADLKATEVSQHAALIAIFTKVVTVLAM